MWHFRGLAEVTPGALPRLLRQATRLKGAQKRRQAIDTLARRQVALVFEKPSMRTRVSFESAVTQLGGTSLFLSAQDVGLCWRESVADFARTMSPYLDAMVLRGLQQST